MYALILGCGSTGIKVAEWLMGSGTEVTMIESNTERQKLADNLFGSVVGLGAGTNDETWEEAGH